MSDPTRFTDWSPDTLEILEAPPPPDPNAAVVYEVDKVTAYFDDEGRSVAPALATWAKVWTPDDTGGTKLEIVSFVYNPDTNRAVGGV